tara:strand:+ start:387 stop:746 length:360 start_codon:yes stop_codon:yes gene_type:complete
MTDMVIYSGKKGSLVFYFENNIIGSLPLGKRSIDDYYIQRDRLLKEALEAQKLKVIKKTFWRGLHKFKNFEFSEDNEFICMTMMCLMKLKQIDPDGDTEGLFIAPKKKGLRPSKRAVCY